MKVLNSFLLIIAVLLPVAPLHAVCIDKFPGKAPIPVVGPEHQAQNRLAGNLYPWSDVAWFISTLSLQTQLTEALQSGRATEKFEVEATWICPGCEVDHLGPWNHFEQRPYGGTYEAFSRFMIREFQVSVSVVRNRDQENLLVLRGAAADVAAALDTGYFYRAGILGTLGETEATQTNLTRRERKKMRELQFINVFKQVGKVHGQQVIVHNQLKSGMVFSREDKTMRLKLEEEAEELANLRKLYYERSIEIMRSLDNY